jgi:hypothetical protein
MQMQNQKIELDVLKIIRQDSIQEASENTFEVVEGTRIEREQAKFLKQIESLN